MRLSGNNNVILSIGSSVNRDPAVHWGVAALLLAVALPAATLPAWRAARVQPTEALRDD